MEEYSRDSRSPNPKSEIVSKVMRGNKAKNTEPELKLRKALREIGLPGYRLHWKKAPGRPDISYPKFKIAIFVHGDFWHRCPICDLPYPKNNLEFWQHKLNENVKRDQNKVHELRENGWIVFVCWEHEIRQDVMMCAKKIKVQYESLSQSIKQKNHRTREA